MAGTEEGEQAVTNCLTGRGRDTQLPGHGLADQLRIGQRFERDERHAVGELVGDGVRGGDGQRGLADTTGPGQRHQAHLSSPQHPGDGSQLLRPADQRPAPDRQRRGGRPGGRAGEAVRQQQRQVIGDQATQLGGIREGAIGNHAFGPDLLQEASQPRLAP